MSTYKEESLKWFARYEKADDIGAQIWWAATLVMFVILFVPQNTPFSWLATFLLMIVGWYVRRRLAIRWLGRAMEFAKLAGVKIEEVR